MSRAIPSMIAPIRQKSGVVTYAGKYDIADGFKTGVLSANQQRVYLSETQLKSASEADQPDILGNIQELGLLTAVEESGLLPLLEKQGLTLKFIEKLGLLSTVENLGVLSTISNPATPTALYATSLGLALFSTAALALFPSDDALEGTLKTVLLLGGSGGALAAAVGARVLDTIQGRAYTRVGVDSGRVELQNLAEERAKAKMLKKGAPPVLSNIEKMKLLSQVEKSGLLSKLEDAGFSFEKVQELKLLTTAEKTKVLSIISNTETPGKLSAASALLAAAAAALVLAVPDTDSTLIAAQAAGAATLAIPAAASAFGSSFLSNLQKSG